MLAGIDDDAVDFRATYDGEENEPVVLPGGFPNLLANGAAGIAVGMATSIPPHNAGEVCAAAIHLVRHPEATTEALMAFMPGPDFPTGGTLIEERASMLQAYETGRGGFRMRAKWEVERGRLGMWQIVVTEIPYQVQKSQAGGADRRVAGGEEAAVPGGCAGRECGAGAAGAGAEVAHGGAGSADGDDVPGDAAGDAVPVEHERADGGPDA